MSALGQPAWCVSSWMIVISPLPLASKPGRCAATVSVNDSAPRSASSHTAHAVSTLVFE